MPKKARRPAARKHAQEGDGAEQQQAFAALLYGRRLTHLAIVKKPRNPGALEVWPWLKVRSKNRIWPMGIAEKWLNRYENGPFRIPEVALLGEKL